MKYLLFILFSIPVLVYSQTSKSDSIFKLIERTNSKEKKSNLYLELAKIYEKTQIDSSIYFAEKGFNLAKQSNNKDEIAKKALVLGRYYLINSKINQAIFHLQIAANYYKNKKNPYEYCTIEMNLANIDLLRNNSVSALKRYYKCLDIANKNKFSDLKPVLNNNIGVLFSDIENYRDAEKYYKIAAKQYQEINKPDKVAFAILNISEVQHKLGNNKNAIQNYQNAINIFSKSGDWEELIYVYYNIADIYIEGNDYKKSEIYIKKALMILDENRKPSPTFTGFISLYKAYLYRSSAVNFYNLNDLNKAIEYALKSIEIATENSYNKLIYENAQILFLAYKKQKKIDLAFKYNGVYLKYKEKFQVENDLKKINQYKMQFQLNTILKEKELELLKKEEKNKRRELTYIGIGIFAVLSILILILLFLYQKSRTDKLALTIENLELERIALKQNIEYKSKELASNVMYLVKQNEFIISLAQRLKEFKTDLNKDKQSVFQEILNDLKYNSSHKVWNEFEVRFKEVYNDFYDSLYKLYPDLSPNEIKICAFLRLNMTTKDISLITHQSVKTINTARFRLRKKLNIDTQENLINFLSQL